MEIQIAKSGGVEIQVPVSASPLTMKLTWLYNSARPQCPSL